MIFRPRDIIEIKDGLLLVVKDVDKKRKIILARPLYVPLAHYSGTFGRKIRKINSLSYIRLEYQFDNKYYAKKYKQLIKRNIGISVFEIPFTAVIHHYSATQRVQELMNIPATHKIEKSLKHLVKILLNAGVKLSNIGVTGTILLGATLTETSDIDLVLFGANSYKNAQIILKKLEKTGRFRNRTIKQLKQYYIEKELFT